LIGRFGSWWLRLTCTEYITLGDHLGNNSNYGFNLPWWDRLIGTYKDQPDKGHTDMVIGLAQFRDQRKLSLPRVLILPFVGDPGRIPINRH